MRVRARRTEELEACATLLRAVHVADRYPSTWPPDPKQWLVADGERVSWVALEAEQVVGHLALRSSGDQPVWPAWLPSGSADVERLAVLTRFFVDPGARGTGVGGALLDLAEEHAVANGLRLVLEVAVDCRHAIALYERRRWRPVGEALRRTSDGRRVLRVRLFVGPSDDAR